MVKFVFLWILFLLFIVAFVCSLSLCQIPALCDQEMAQQQLLFYKLINAFFIVDVYFRLIF